MEWKWANGDVLIKVWGDKGLTSVVAVEIKGYFENGQESVFMNRGAQKKNELMMTDR